MIDDKYNNIKYNLSNNININKEIIKIDKEFIYNKYIKTTSFSDLFSKRPVQGQISPARPLTPPVQTQASSPSVTVQPQTIQTQPVQTQKPSPSANTQYQPNQTPPIATGGRVYDASQMWSPISLAGRVYEWNRGVIGISKNGEVVKESLDGTLNHHSDATVRVVNTLGGNITYDSSPFQMGVDGADEGILVFQSEGDNALIYFPESLSNEQVIALGDILTPRTRFNFSFTYNGEVFEEQTVREVVNFAINISALRDVAVRR